MTDSEFYGKVIITWEHDDSCNQDVCRATMSCGVTGGIDHEMPEEVKSQLEEILKRRLHNFMVEEFGGGNANLKMAYHVGYDDGLAGRHCNPEKAVM